MRKSQTKNMASFCKTPNQTQPPSDQSSVLDVNLPSCFSMHIYCFLRPWRFSGASPATGLLASLEGLAVSRCSLLYSCPCCLMSLQQALQAHNCPICSERFFTHVWATVISLPEHVSHWRLGNRGGKEAKPRLNKTSMNILITFWPKATGIWKCCAARVTW